MASNKPGNVDDVRRPALSPRLKGRGRVLSLPPPQSAPSFAENRETYTEGLISCQELLLIEFLPSQKMPRIRCAGMSLSMGNAAMRIKVQWEPLTAISQNLLRF